MKEQGVEEDDRGSLNRFPDEILLHISNKLLDLKCLCRCYLVSKRFSSLILHVHSVSFTVPRLNQENPNPIPDKFPQKLFRLFTNGVIAKPLQFLRQIVAPKPLPAMISSFYGDSFRSAVHFLSKFKGIRSLQIQLPSSCHGGRSINDDSLLKWTAKFGSRIESFLFLSPTSVHETKEFFNAEEEEDSRLTNDLLKQRVHMAFQCLKDVIVRHRFMLVFVREHRKLQSIEITDSSKQGRLFLRGKKVAEVRNWIDSERDKPELKRIEVPVSVSQCYVPVLELPLSGCVMKGATLVLMQMVDGNIDDDLAVIVDDFEDLFGDETYTEAVVEIMVEHKSKMKTLL